MATGKSFPLIPPSAPNLPIGPVDYDQRYQDNLLNSLRLYFNQIDNMGQGLLTNNAGGSYLKFPYIGASDITNQYAIGNDVPTIVTWNTLDYGNAFTLNSNYTATAQISGIYKIDYSLQFTNTINAQHDVTVWLRINGYVSAGAFVVGTKYQITTSGTTDFTLIGAANSNVGTVFTATGAGAGTGVAIKISSDVAGSASKFSLQQRKSAGVYTYLVAYSSVVFQLNAGDSVGLWWATDKAYSPTGPVEGVYMAYEAPQTSPYNHPSIPSAVGSITFLSALP